MGSLEELIKKVLRGKHVNTHRAPTARDVKLELLREMASKASGMDIDVYGDTDTYPKGASGPADNVGGQAKPGMPGQNMPDAYPYKKKKKKKKDEE